MELTWRVRIDWLHGPAEARQWSPCLVSGLFVTTDARHGVLMAGRASDRAPVGQPARQAPGLTRLVR